MPTPLRLSIVDQSPVRSGGTGADALRETVELAVLAERWGYHRYWVAEHHNAPEFAATTPAIMVGQIAARTSTMRIGSGGVLLSNYSALQVAESFRVLESLHPGRIDLGLGRAPGGDRRVTAALGAGRDGIPYADQVDDLIGLLTGDVGPYDRLAGIKAGPTNGGIPDIWLLGSGGESAALAARRGLPLSLVHFFSRGQAGGPAMVDQYRRAFQPSPLLAEPRVNIAVSVLCAESEAAARHLAWSLWFMRIRSARGQTGPIESPEYARTHITASELASLDQSRPSDIIGDPRQVKKGIEDIAALYRVDDLSIITVCHAFADRLRSYELIARACGITPSRPHVMAHEPGV